MAKEIGQNIGKAYTIVEEGLDNRRYAANVLNTSGFTMGGSFSEEESSIALGQISITARVVVSFELK
jgi:hypothetical protein